MRYLALLLAAPKTLPQPPSALSPASGPPPPWPGPALERFAIPGFDHGHRALQHGGISAIPGQLDRVAPEVLHQLHIEATQLFGLDEDADFKVVGVGNPSKLQEDLSGLAAQMEPPLRLASRWR